MKSKILYLLIITVIIAAETHGQTIEIGANFTSSNAPFYKNAFGINMGFNYNFKKQYLLAEIKGSLKNNSYSQIAPDLSDGSGYVMHEVDGKMQNISIRTGIGQKIVSTNELGISLGVFMSLNYFKLKEDIHYFNYDPIMMNFDKNISKDEFVKNRIGGGLFIDLELKQIILKNISLFSRCIADIVKYDGQIDGDPFCTSSIKDLGFSIGMKVALNK